MNTTISMITADVITINNINDSNSLLFHSKHYFSFFMHFQSPEPLVYGASS